MAIRKEDEFTKKLDLSVWIKLLRYAKNYKREMIFLTFIMIFVGGIDVFLPLMTKIAIDEFVVKNTVDGLWGFALLFGILTVVQTFNVWLLIVIAGKIEMGVCYDIRKDGFNRLQELSFSYYDKTPIGWMMARMTSDVQKIGRTIAWGLVDMVWGVSVMLGIMGVILVLNWKLALVVLTIIPVLVIVSFYFQQKILKSHREVRKINSKITGGFNEGITGAKTTKTLVCEQENLSEFQLVTSDMKYNSIRAAVFSAIYLPFVIVLGSVGAGLALWKGGNFVISGAITYGTLVAFIQYTMQFFDPVREVARIITEIQSAQASAERIMKMIDTKPDIKDSDEVKEKFSKIGQEDLGMIKGDIVFDNVEFYYKKEEKVLQNFNLEVKAGETIAFVGETGSGKSTIVNLICRFYEPKSGVIKIDGVDYKKMPIHWLHSSLGYVLQSPHLFSGTVRENIRYGKLDATEEEIIEVAKLVNAHRFISKFEKGYDTEVGEGGNRLSTGEKQLISFARAIISNPSIFVLDEATSSVDTETEMLIQDAIQKILKGRTSFIIAHRLSTIKSADRIIVIKKGKIIEEGNHQELLDLGGYYNSLYTNQFMGG